MHPTAPASKRVVIATGNAHKTEEFRALFGPGWTVEDLRDHPQLSSPEETGSTFEENARIKALAAGSRLGEECLVVADDSGLEVDALNLAPGVHSARYAGPNATDAENRAKLLKELALTGAKGKARRGRFRCTLVVARGSNVLATFSGTVEGILANDARGHGGFGYDPLFIPDGYCETFGQLPAEVKNSLSHRSRAAAALRKWLEQS